MVVVVQVRMPLRVMRMVLRRLVSPIQPHLKTALHIQGVLALTEIIPMLMAVDQAVVVVASMVVLEE